MGRLSRIEQIVNDTISHYAHVKIVPRGLPRFVDTSLRGTVRFAKRSGNTIAVLNPDNTYAFAYAPQTRDNKFTLLNPNKWIIEDCILSLGPEKELQQVYDIVDQTVLLKTNLTGTYTVDDKVLLHSYPMLMAIDVESGTTTIMVKTYYPLANGDIFLYLQDENLLQSLSEIKVITATKLGSIGDSYFGLLYSLELESPIQKNITSNTIVYLRAYPAYFSATIRIPNSLNTSEPIGPFLVDLLTGRLLEGQEFDETFAIRTLNRIGNYTVGNSTSYVTIDKNYLILDRTVPVHAPMFWELAEGSMRLTPTKIVMKVASNLTFDNLSLIPFDYDASTGIVQYIGNINLVNVDIGNFFRDGSGVEYIILNVDTIYSNITIVTFSGITPLEITTTVSTHLDGSIREVTNNKFCVGLKCIPNFSANHSWKLSLLSNEDCTIRFIFTPHDPQEFSLVSGVSKNVTILLSAGVTVTNIEVNILSLANICEVRMSEWSPAKDTVEQIEYSFVSTAAGIGTYQATGLILKPYFMGSEFLKINYDNNANYDSGKIYF